MEKLRIKIGKKKTVSAMVDEFTIGGTTDHDSLKNRDMNNQHPINAITGLEDALNDRVTNENLIAEVDSALKSAKDSGLFNGKDGKDGHTPQKGIDYFDGEPGNDGVGILSIEQESASSTDGGENIIKITLTDGRVQRFIIKNGSGGEVEISQYDVINALGYTPIDREKIVDDLETNVANYPLSAAQGAKLKRLIDDITVPTKTSQLTNDSGFLTRHQDLSSYAKKTDVPTALSDLTGDSTHRLVTDDEKVSWNNKSNFSGHYDDLKNKPIIPTKTSQLYNDSDFVKATDLETGEATWDSIKGNILETTETEVTWDGNTEGVETHPRFTTYYKISDVVLTAEDAVGCSYYNSKTNKELMVTDTVQIKGSGYWLIYYGVMCVYDEVAANAPKGLYFYKGTLDDGTTNEYNVTEFILRKEQVKEELLPENIGGGTVDMSKYFETVSGDILEWDGNTEGKYFLSEASCHVSNFAPPLDELKKGGFFTFSLGSTSEDVPFTSDEIMSADEMGFGSGLTLVTENGNPYIIIVHTPNATASLDGMTLPANVPVGTYFYYGADDDYVKALTINGYSFKKEVIKEEYLPPMEGMTVKRREFTSHADLHSFLSENCENVLKAMLRLLYEEAGTVYIEDMVYTNVSKLDYGDSYSFALSKNEYNFGFDGSTTPDLYFTAGRIEVKENGGHFSHGNYWLKHSADTGFTYEADEDATSMIFDDEILASMGGRYIIFYAD